MQANVVIIQKLIKLMNGVLKFVSCDKHQLLYMQIRVEKLPDNNSIIFINKQLNNIMSIDNQIISMNI